MVEIIPPGNRYSLYRSTIVRSIVAKIVKIMVLMEYIHLFEMSETNVTIGRIKISPVHT
jgi:hypothetical protein